MGLDMYLKAKKYLSGWNHSTPKEKNEFAMLRAVAKDVPICAQAPSGYLEFNVAYWRKANEIHKWFVENVQNGADDCGEYYVSREQLEELREACQAVLNDPDKAKTVMPTQSGFFFGSTEYDEYYLKDLRETVQQVEAALKCPEQWEFEYHSSW